MQEVVQTFVNSEAFREFKLMIYEELPSGEARADKHGETEPIVLAHGNYLGAREVFRRLRLIAEFKPEPEQPKRKPGTPDPDLD